MTPPQPPVPDRRVQRTHKLLRDALGSLILEKSYDAIAVQEILDRANVGRSTFYAHYRDKDALLAAGIHDMLGAVRAREPVSAVGGRERILSFSLPTFEHLYRHRRAGKGRMGARGRTVLHRHLRRELAELIAAELGDDPQGRRNAADEIPSGLLAQFVSSTFILVLNWWVESGSLLPPVEVNDLFHALVGPTLKSSCG